MLKSVLWNTNIIINTTQNIYNNIFQSTVLYESETWVLKKAQKERLLSLKMDFCRRSAGKSRLEGVRNETIRETM